MNYKIISALAVSFIVLSMPFAGATIKVKYFSEQVEEENVGSYKLIYDKPSDYDKDLIVGIIGAAWKFFTGKDLDLGKVGEYVDTFFQVEKIIVKIFSNYKVQEIHAKDPGANVIITYQPFYKKLFGTQSREFDDFVSSDIMAEYEKDSENFLGSRTNIFTKYVNKYLEETSEKALENSLTGIDKKSSDWLDEFIASNQNELMQGTWKEGEIKITR